MPPRYKDVDECRQEIRQYCGQLDAGTDNADPERRDQGSTDRYKQDLRWYDHWLDETGLDSPTDVSPSQANLIGQTISKEFNGTTGLYRWDRIFAFHEWLLKMEIAESNPFERWNDEKKEKFGLTKSTEQSRQLDDGERYATTQDDIRVMEENVTGYRVRDQLIIRLLWQTGMRRGEASGITLADLDREEREITIRAPVAKNDKERQVAYQQSLDGLLKEWLDYGRREEMTASTDHNRLLAGERGAPLSGERINEIVIDAADEAGINRRTYADANAAVDAEGNPVPNRWKISAHNIRHGFGTHMVNDTDAGLWEISQAMGHSSVTVTEQTYVEDDPRAGVDHLHKFGPE